MNRDAETVPAHHETPDVAELRRLAEAATPGPWAARYGVSWEARVCATTGSLADVDSTANAELIAAAVNALPGLLDAAAERDALAADADKWQRAALTLQGDRDALLDELDELRLPYYPRPRGGAPAVKRQPIPAAQWWRNASETFKVVAEYLDMAKRAELRDVGHDCGHTFRIRVEGRSHSSGVVTDIPLIHSDADWWHDDGTVEVRAHNLRDALLLAAAKPLAEWVMPDDEDEEPQPS